MHLRSATRHLTFWLLAAVIFFITLPSPLLAAAGGCKCTGQVKICEDNQPCATSTDIAQCVKTYKAEPVTTQQDCNLVIDEKWPGNANTINCQYTSSDVDCGFYTKSELACPNKYGEDTCATYGGFCKDGFCQLPPDGLERFKNLPSFLGVQADLQIKKPFLSIKIPGLSFSDNPEVLEGKDGKKYLQLPYLIEYLTALYKFGLNIATVIAVCIIIFQGFAIVVSRGGSGKTEAYNRIGQVCIGLIILWSTYTILNLINPALVNLKALNVEYVEGIPLIDVIDEPITPVPIQPGVNNVPMYKQFAAQWGKITYGEDAKCTTIAQAGCGPTSLAMVLSSYGTQVTPDVTASFMGKKGNGRVCNQGTAMDATVKKLNGSPWPSFEGKKVTKSEAMGLLRDKKPVIFLCHDCTGQSSKGTKSYKGHYMVLTGIDAANTVTVNDPGANDTKAIKTMTQEQLDKNGGFWYVHPK